MNATPQKMLATLKTTAEARVGDLSAASDSVMAVAEHLTALNLNTTRSMMDDALALSQSMPSPERNRHMRATLARHGMRRNGPERRL